jgi:ubiquinone/menaquinone biosynthesis C-methylase UbiE
MKQNRLYDEFAHLYPLISGPEAYAREAKVWKEILRAKLGPGRHKIVEMGVGGGFNLSHFAFEFDCTALDLSEKMLENSRKLNPGVPHMVGDMRTVRLNKTFDAVLIHDAICYMLTEDDLRATFATASAHLNPGGVFLCAPDYFKETFVDGMVRHNTLSDGRVKLTHLEFEYDSDPNDTVNELVLFYLIREGGNLHIEQDFHTLGLFPIQTWLDLLDEAGFNVDKRPYNVHDDGREAYLLVSTKR